MVIDNWKIFSRLFNFDKFKNNLQINRFLFNKKLKFLNYEKKFIDINIKSIKICDLIFEVLKVSNLLIFPLL